MIRIRSPTKSGSTYSYLQLPGDLKYACISLIILYISTFHLFYFFLSQMFSQMFFCIDSEAPDQDNRNRKQECILKASAVVKFCLK